jgi:hypothetical protein
MVFVIDGYLSQPLLMAPNTLHLLCLFKYAYLFKFLDEIT